MSNVRLGIIGLGNMGAHHAANLLAGKVPRLTLTAVADANPARASVAPDAKFFTSPAKLMRSGLVDAVLIATPHYQHTPLGIAALRAGLHVMVEKPIAVHKAEADRLLVAYEALDKKPVFAAMFNQRTDRFYQRIRELIQSGELGEVRRINWTITTWYRTAAYYKSSAWRATWAGEGGGVLLNQCPHNLDLLQWLFGQPSRVRAHCRFGRYHQIEVEDDVTAYLEFPNGASGVFITSTGEAPGTNRLEVAGENGRLVYENDQLSFLRNSVPMGEFSQTSTDGFARPPSTEVSLTADGHGGQHNEILANFTAAILDGAPLISPAVEGSRSVELANAMLLSAWTDETIDLPMNATRYARLLKKKIATSPLTPALA